MKAFVSSMYFPWLHREYGLTPVEVLSYVCPWDKTVNIIGSTCRECHRKPEFNRIGGRRFRLATQDWLVIPSAVHGAFAPVKFSRCAACGRLFPKRARLTCRVGGETPYCKAAQGAQPKTVWVPREGENFSLDVALPSDEAESHVPWEMVVMPDIYAILDKIDRETALRRLSPGARGLALDCLDSGLIPSATELTPLEARFLDEVRSWLRRYLASKYSI